MLLYDHVVCLSLSVGVGKTSIARSIARALNREVRLYNKLIQQ